MQGKQGERRVHFGVFEADLDAAELFKNGMKLRLTEQPFQLLAVLLERPGELVSREELRRRLWAEDTNVDFDRSLNTAASKLRDALGDSAETPRYVQTLPKRGYRFIAPVNEVLASASQKQPLLGRYKNQVTVGAAALLVLVALYAWWRLPFPIPRVVRIVQLSNDGLGKATALATDGPRIYFMASQGASHFLAQIADAGGDTELIPLRSFGPERSGSVRGISHDHQRLLVAAQTSRLGPDFSLWSITPIRPAGRSLGIAAHDADWSPDGRHITYVLFQDLWVADSDGRNAHKLVQDGRILSSPRWAPDGKRIRFTAMSPSARLWRAPEEGVILEIAADGGPVRRVFPERTADHWDGRWTHDGNYFVFNSGSDIWAVRGTKGSKPFQLTYGPLQFRAPTPSPDGRRLYTIGAARRGELLRYDIQREQFVPVFRGLSADNLSYSPNAEWFVYVTYPQG
ncbi:MAG TPA: winged helix-turn-helix domain-containing protein, partial [Candidatus Acidoferrum sp.]|nr:winged helix-turn-helix domain-containing protein [Candidatus Acidoferrum sp.]